MSARQDLADASRIPGDLLEALAAVRSARVAAVAEAAEAEAERQSLMPGVRRGDARALTRTATLNQQVLVLAARIDRCAADEDALAERFGEALELQQRAVPGRPCPIAIAKALSAQDRQVDQLMQKLENSLFARQGLTRRLATAGNVNLRALQSVTRLRAAAGHHGLSAYFEMTPVPPHLQASLEAINAPLLKAVLHPPMRRFAVPPAPVKTPEEVSP
jgi:hypothetical protein